MPCLAGPGCPPPSAAARGGSHGPLTSARRCSRRCAGWSRPSTPSWPSRPPGSRRPRSRGPRHRSPGPEDRPAAPQTLLRSWKAGCSCGYLTQVAVGRLEPGGLEPDEEAIDDKPAVDGKQHSGGVEVRMDEQRNANQVDGDPGQPEVVPASGHRVGRDHRADEDPGVTPVVPARGRPAGADLGEDPLRDCNTTDPDRQVLQPFGGGGPARSNRKGVAGRVRSLARVRSPDPAPPPPAIDAGDDKEDLPAGLTVERLVLRSHEGHSEEDREQQHVADDPDRPCPDPPLHSPDRRGKTEPVPDDLAPEDRLSEDAQLGVKDALDNAHTVGSVIVAGWVSSRSTYLAITSTSRLTRSPTPLCPNVVSSSVVGMSETEKVSSVSAETVSETPSMVIEPFSTT